MSMLQDSSDRPVSDYVFFGVGFAGVMATAYGLVGTSVPIAVVGISLLGISVGVFFLKMLLSSE